MVNEPQSLVKVLLRKCKVLSNAFTCYMHYFHSNIPIL